MRTLLISLLLFLFYLSGCGMDVAGDGKADTLIIDTSKINHYPWRSDYPVENMLVNRIQPPAGYQRKKIAAGTYGDWLRHLPLKEADAAVYWYNGEIKPNQRAHEAVVDIDVGTRDLQQCADAVMRLRSEYLYSKKDYKKIHFNFTSGHTVKFDDWRKGKKPIVKGNKVKFSKPTGEQDNSYQNFKKYLQTIFTYAGSKSLERELTPKKTKDVQIGDVFIKGGFPGHAVLVVDLAVDANGNKVMLLAQSYMPAQDIHILKNLYDTEISPWYYADDRHKLFTPEWTFDVGALREF